MRLLFLVLVVAICARAETIRRLVRDNQCTGPSYTELIPLGLAIVDFCVYQRYKPPSPRDNSNMSVYELLDDFWANSRFRYIIVTAALCLSSATILHRNDKLSSTYVCTSANHTTIITIQYAALALDFSITFCLDALIRSPSISARATPAKSMKIPGCAFLVCALAISIWGVIWFIAVPEDRFWLLEIPQGFVWRLIKLSLLCCITVVSACVTVSAHVLE
jgi:hypothetical protein